MNTLINIIPQNTEKAYRLANTHNTYLFTAPLGANKKQIKAAVEAQFNVRVERVRTLVHNGKVIKFNRGKRRYPGTTAHSDTKRVYTRLAAGDSIQVFDTAAKNKEETK
jgi:large subunit ribosomal protein L23